MFKIEDQGLILDADGQPPSWRIAYFTSLCVLRSGTILCGCQNGPGKHAVTSAIRLSRSMDDGRSWELLPAAFETRIEDTPGSLGAAELVEVAPGRLLLFATWFGRSDPSRPLFDPVSAGMLKAQQLLEKADRLCSREHRSSAACTEVSFDIAYHLGRAHEEQRHLAQAMAEYEKAIELSSRSRAKPELLAEAQDGIVRLVPRLGVLIVPKKGRGGCQEVSIWMEPGQHEIQVNGQRTSVEVRAHEKQKVGSCSASEQ